MTEQSPSSTAPRWLWFFKLIEPPGKSQYLCASYITEDPDEATQWAEGEYGITVEGAVRRFLTWHQYCALLMCNREGDHGSKVYDAIQEVFYLGRVPEAETPSE